MSHFNDVFMPLGVGFGSQAGKLWNTQVQFVGGGGRFANARWQYFNKQLNLVYIKDTGPDYLDAVLAEIADVHTALMGSFHTGLVRDHFDWNTSARQEPGGDSFITGGDALLKNETTGLYTGDGSETDFQCFKRYAKGSASHDQSITKPSATGFVAWVNGSPATGTLDAATGIFTFDSAPGNGLSTAWGGTFWSKFAFVEDFLPASLIDAEIGSFSSIPLVGLAL